MKGMEEWDVVLLDGISRPSCDLQINALRIDDRRSSPSFIAPTYPILLSFDLQQIEQTHTPCL